MPLRVSEAVNRALNVDRIFVDADRQTRERPTTRTAPATRNPLRSHLRMNIVTAWTRSHRPPSSSPRTREHLSTLPFDDTRDFEDADRGFIAALEPCVVKAADGRVVWDNDVYAFLSGDAPTTVHPEPVAAVASWSPSRASTRWSRASTRCAASTCPTSRFVEGDTGHHRHRPADLHRDRGRGAGAVPRAPRRPAGRRGDLHPQPRRPLRRRARRDDAGRRRRGQGRGHRARGLHRARRAGERLRRAPRWRAAPATCTAPRSTAGRRDRSGCGLGQTPSTGEVALIVPTVDITHDRRDAHHRRRRDRVPDGAGHRGARRDALLLPEVPRAVHGRERHPQPAQPADPARCAGARPARLGRLPDRGDRHVRRPHRRRVRLAPLADVGQGAHRRIPFAATRSVRVPARPDAAAAQPGLHRHRDRRDLPDAARAARRPGTPTATTDRSATTSRRSTSATWAGSTATRPGCGRTRRRRSGRATSRRWAASTASSRSPRRRSTTATSVGRQRCSTTRCSPTRTTPRRAQLYADTLEQLAYGAENGTWRNFFLSGATELRDGNFGTPTQTASPSMMAQLTPEQMFDALAISVNGPKAWDLDLAIDITFLDAGRQLPAHAAQRRAGVPQGHPPTGAHAQATIRLATKVRLLGLAAGTTRPRAGDHRRRRGAARSSARWTADPASTSSRRSLPPAPRRTGVFHIAQKSHNLQLTGAG